MTRTTRAVLDVLLAHPEQERYGLDLSREAGIAHGTLYGILERLEGWGWLESHVVYPPERATPPRRYYRLTREGAARADAALARRTRTRWIIGSTATETS